MKKLKEIWSKTDDVIARYPMVLVMAFIAAICTVIFIFRNSPRYFQDNSEDELFAISKIIIVACLGISLMFAVKMISQRIGKGFVWEILGVLFLIGFYFLLPKKENDFTEVYAFLLIPTFILSHLLVSFGAFIGKERELNFWQYNKNLFINIFLTAVFTGVLTGGILLAILAVDKLFDFHISGYRYAQTASFLAIFGSSFIFLLFNEKGLEYLEKEGNYPQILKFFTQFVLIPLLLIYVVILYFYSIKILINWELPRGWVSYLVLAYSIIGILALLLVYPLKEKSAKSWVQLFSKIFYFTLIPLLVLLFVAIFTRILEYGYTEPRYFVLLLALWLSSVVWYFILKKNATIKFIPISMFLFGLFALLFPYFNAFSVAKRSQKEDLEKILNENQLIKDGKIDFTKKINIEVVDELASKAEFLYQRKEDDFINRFLDYEKKRKLDSINTENRDYFAKQEFSKFFTNVDYQGTSINPSGNYQNVFLRVQKMNIPIADYEYLLNGFESFQNTFEIDGKKIEISPIKYTSDKPEIWINFEGEKFDMYPELQRILFKYNYSGQYDVAEISFSKIVKNYEFKFFFGSLQKQFYSNEPPKIYIQNNYFILVKKLD